MTVRIGIRLRTEEHRFSSYLHRCTNRARKHMSSDCCASDDSGAQNRCKSRKRNTTSFAPACTQAVAVAPRTERPTARLAQLLAVVVPVGTRLPSWLQNLLRGCLHSWLRSRRYSSLRTGCSRKFRTFRLFLVARHSRLHSVAKTAISCDPRGRNGRSDRLAGESKLKLVTKNDSRERATKRNRQDNLLW